MSFSRKVRNKGNLSANIVFGGNNSRKHHRQFQGSRERGFRRRVRYVSMVTLDNLDGLLFNGSSTVLFPFLFINNKFQNNPCQFDCALSPYRQRKREDVLYFSRLSLGTKTKNNCNTIKTCIRNERQKLVQ